MGDVSERVINELEEKHGEKTKKKKKGKNIAKGELENKIRN